MTDAQARARVWTLCLAALVRAALTGPRVGLLTPLAHAHLEQDDREPGRVDEARPRRVHRVGIVDERRAIERRLGQTPGGIAPRAQPV